MDFVLDIIIPKTEVKTVKLNEKLVTWGDSVYSCEPPQYVTDSGILFEQVEDIQYFNKIVDEEFGNDVIILNLKSDIIMDLEYFINIKGKEEEENKLFIFLHELFKLSEFYILLIREDEKVKERYRIITEEEIGIKLSDSLRWSNPKDILLFKKKEG